MGTRDMKYIPIVYKKTTLKGKVKKLNPINQSKDATIAQNMATIDMNSTSIVHKKKP